MLSFYGDDFTGSTDVMETLSMNGVPAVLFLEAPDPDEVLQFQLKENVGGDQLRAFGVAGIARSLPPNEMEKELTPVFAKMRQIPADYFQYKVCSTLDSSPEIGNIGVATEVASRFFDASRIPMVIGAPFLNRFVVFSNLFARIDDTTYRLDRHPVMSKHPVTPMKESDIRLHLGQQSTRGFHTLDVLQLEAGDEALAKRYQDVKDGSFILFDTLTYDHLDRAGQLMYEGWKGNSELLVGSSGITYGLARHIQSLGSENPVSVKGPGKAANVLVVSGSCSPITSLQMHAAEKSGFQMISVDVSKFLDDTEKEVRRLASEASKVMASGHHPIIFSADGPDDPCISKVKDKLGDQTSQVIGQLFANVVTSILVEASDVRLVVVGGDTSGYVSRSLEIYALEMLCPIAPGAPLCVAHSRSTDFDGLQIALKGGQNGKADYFHRILEGKAT